MIEGLERNYIKERDQIQIYSPNNGARSDIFLVTRSASNGKSTFTSVAYKDSVPPRFKEDIFPLKTAKWLGLHVKIPDNPQKVSEETFGSNFMTPHLDSVECFEQFWNFRAPWLWWLALLAASGIGAMAGISIYDRGLHISSKTNRSAAGTVAPLGRV